MRWKEIRPLNHHVEGYRLNMFIALLVEQEIEFYYGEPLRFLGIYLLQLALP